MNTCTTPTLIINDTDAVGDSAGKHNYNALVLDTNICNLSSQLFLNYNNINTVFQSITSYINIFTQIAPFFNTERVYKMSEAATAVRMLSAYWNKQEFSVQYPINGAVLNSGDIINAPALSAISQNSVAFSVQSRLKPLADIYVNANFTPTSFIDGTIINVNFFLYNVTPNPTNPNHLITFNSNPNTFSYLVRQMSVSFFRDNIYFTQGVNVRYYKINGIWNYIGYEAGKYSDSVSIAGINRRPKTTKNALEIIIPEKVLKSNIITSTSSIYIPSDVTKILLFMVGGGGGGGGGYFDGTNRLGGGGGGGGGVVLGTYTVSANTTYTVTVGNGGNGGTLGNSGQSGTTTIFNNISALGGLPGGGGNSNSIGGTAGPFGGNGGSGRTLTQFASAGRDGFEYTDVLNYPNGEFFAGGGGGGGSDQPLVAFGGEGGGGQGGNGSFPGSSGLVNTGGGGGGGGGGSNAGPVGNGGNGGKGVVIISYYTTL